MLLSKQSQKTYRIATGKNKQEEKRLALEVKILEKNADFEDTKWLRELIKLRKSLADIRFKCDYETIDNPRHRDVKSAPPEQAKSHDRASAKKSATSSRLLRPNLGTKSATKTHRPQTTIGHSGGTQSAANRTSTRPSDLANRYLLFPGNIRH